MIKNITVTLDAPATKGLSDVLSLWPSVGRGSETDLRTLLVAPGTADKWSAVADMLRAADRIVDASAETSPDACASVTLDAHRVSLHTKPGATFTFTHGKANTVRIALACVSVAQALRLATVLVGLISTGHKVAGLPALLRAIAKEQAQRDERTQPTQPTTATASVMQ